MTIEVTEHEVPPDRITVCDNCGAEGMTSLRCTCRWDFVLQEWCVETDELDLDESYCNNCGSDTTLWRWRNLDE